MRITESMIRRIIREETQRTLNEGEGPVSISDVRDRLQSLSDRISAAYPGGVRNYTSNMLNQEYPDLGDPDAVESHISELRNMFANTLERVMVFQTQLGIALRDLDRSTED